MIVGASCHDRPMSSAVVAILTLVIGLLIGLVLGIFIAGRRTSTTGISEAAFASVRAERDLYKSERDNAMAGSKLAGEIEAMKTAMEKLQKESAGFSSHGRRAASRDSPDSIIARRCR